MKLSLPLLIPLACALLYVISALVLKRAAALGVGVWRTSFVANWVVALMFFPLWFWRNAGLPPAVEYLQPALVAVLFLGGQTLTFLALNSGDVSVISPVMGTKVILVALSSTLLHVGFVPLQWWAGAALSTGAIGLLHVGAPTRHREVGRTVLLAFGSAVSFSLGDVLMQKWVPAWGAAGFFPPMFLVVGVLSFAFVPLFHAPLSALDARAWRWVLPGAGLMALNNAGIVLAIALVGSATVVNVIYSLRGLFSVLLVWSIGHWFANEEQHLSPKVLRLRLTGAGLMVAAVALVLV